MNIFGYASVGYEGLLVKVEVDLRRTIPGMDIVGLPDSAVKESRDRIRAALMRSNYQFPRDRILVNLAPAGLKKEGASFDLSITAALLIADKQITVTAKQILVMGELELSGMVRPVSGILAAASYAHLQHIDYLIVPEANLKEAQSVLPDRTLAVNHINQLKKIFDAITEDKVIFPEKGSLDVDISNQKTSAIDSPDFSDIKGLEGLKRAAEIAVSGGHNLLLFGPPGGGKTMVAMALAGIQAPMGRLEAIETTRIWSQAGKLNEGGGLLTSRPFRMPHHTASVEGILGGGMGNDPGEVSLAHNGILFLDEAAEFRSSLLQGLREPLAHKRISIVRSQTHLWYPANFQLVMAVNPCPCGNLGRKSGICTCSRLEIGRYWKKFGGALLDRIDIRVPVEPVSADLLLQPSGECSETVRKRIILAAEIQERRYKSEKFLRNSDIPSGKVATYCKMDGETELQYRRLVQGLGLSSRACYSVLKVARTAADMEQSPELVSRHILEAAQYRRFGDGKYFWK